MKEPNGIIFTDDLAVITRPVPGLPGVFVKICGPGYRHDWRGALPPHLAPLERVSWNDWCDVQDSIREGDPCIATDLILEERDVAGVRRLCYVVNLWDPYGRRWILLSEEDSRVPYENRQRIPKSKPWLEATATGIPAEKARVNVLAIIPARGGSKTVPRKNLREVGGKPLIAWSIEAARGSKLITRTVVSTDDPMIAFAAAGTEVLMRPPWLATDDAPTDPVLVHATRSVQEIYGEPVDLVVLLQPTVPVRAPGLIDACIERLLKTGANSLLTVNRLHFCWWRWKDAARWSTNSINRPRRQDMPPCDVRYHEDGSVYVVRAEELLAKGRRLVEPIEVLETERTVDIDTERDLVVADALLRAGFNGIRTEPFSTRIEPGALVPPPGPIIGACACRDDEDNVVPVPTAEQERMQQWARDVFHTGGR